jgi:lipopolysaccharide/colanic/teichoic acid biosynthesis glycosyltransferase
VSAQDHYIRRHMPLQAGFAVRYVDDRSFAGDLSILLRTAWCVLFHSFVPQRRRAIDLVVARPARSAAEVSA